MNAESSNCDDLRLHSLLHADESSDDFAAAIAHIEHCDRCRKRLEELAASYDLWKQSRDALTGDELDSRLLQSSTLTTWHRLSGNHPGAVWSDSLAKQLLQPPSHPEMLGRLGRYEIERLIGSGGMGIVFKAFDTELNRPVAIKILAPHLAGNGAARQRFAREARAAAAVVHEHIVAIHNVESNEQAPYLVMQYVAGESLQQRIDHSGALQLQVILRIAMQTAAGLAAAHAQGLVHRDIKPANILLEHGVERALLSDFGLARAGDDASLTHTGYHLGTPQYMSPEQASGEAIDARSDLFSLGSVIYTMCTGRPPFRAETTFGVLRKITDHEPRSIVVLNPEIPDWLQRLVQKLHSKSPDDRFASAEEVHRVLEQCLAFVQQPGSAALPAVIDRPKLRTKERMHRRIFLVAMSAMLIGFCIFVNFLSQPKNATQIVEQQPADATLDWDAVDKSLSDASSNVDEFKQRAEAWWMTLDSEPTESP